LDKSDTQGKKILLPEEEQWNKLKLIKAIAEEVWDKKQILKI